ncbi:DUF3108 domain-containing protein [Coralloluteibacterium thermophilus]|uniref:DUF3108 domain-containing protein n=1 Tax=Coralloluteibacterium thermophilum TaxID=2707049 RepID=A0ABV9NM05_9GAMM
MVRLALLLGLAALAPAAAQASGPAPYEARYEVLRNGSVLGEAQVTLRQTGSDTWELSSHTRGTQGLAAVAGADITERSTFRWSGRGPETTGYRYTQKVAFNSRERSLEVDPAAGRIVSRDRRDEHVLPYTQGVLDRQIVPVALARDLAAGRQEVEYPVADRREVETQRFRATGSERVEVPAGSVDATRVERVRDPGAGRSTTIWLDPARDYLPVRSVQRERDGETIEMRLVGVER